jgi:hypothetical protein
LKDKDNNTIGVRAVIDGREVKLSREDIKKNISNIEFCNAIIVNDGTVRSKQGKLPVETMEVKVDRNARLLKTKIKAPDQSDIAKANKIEKQKIITVYHGSRDKDIVPAFGKGKLNNDYGRGFYTTCDIELGKEWAYAYNKTDTGCLHTFENVNIEGLRVLNLAKYNTMCWIAELISHRTLDNIDDPQGRTSALIKEIIKLFKLDTSEYDLIIGYRADDSYFYYVGQFLDNRLDIEGLEQVIRYGNLGIQVFFKSELAFQRLKNANHKVEAVSHEYLGAYYDKEHTAFKNVKQKLNEEKVRKTDNTASNVVRKYKEKYHVK